ncbi:hypothetical protein ACTJK4_21855 [Ralstonia sp. 22111]|uniref:TubC N-terminal docking domain-related protein n=1 Tax=Ralstonia sp. 22111 TaxID=3453878 RepID=UPI003F84BB39
MNAAAQILSRARAANISLWVEGERLRFKGPKDAVEELKPELAANKPEIVAHLRRATSDAVDLSRYPVADGPYTPYVVPLSPERVAGLLADLRATIGELADREGWTGDQRAHMLGLVARQPASTLADDLAYFLHRRELVRAAELAAQAVGGVRLASG